MKSIRCDHEKRPAHNSNDLKQSTVLTASLALSGLLGKPIVVDHEPKPTRAPLSAILQQAETGLCQHDHAMFAAFSAGPSIRPSEWCLHWLFEAYAQKQPNAVAVEHAGQAITYGELNQKADCLADLLVRNGVRPRDAVGLFLRRSISMVIGILATLKVGAAYVPQDTKIVPRPQLHQVMEQSGVLVILTTSDESSAVPASGHHRIIEIDRALDEYHGNIIALAPWITVHPDDRCFILFTSGTTGKPNGVQVTHKNVANILLNDPGDLGMRPGLRVSQLLDIGCDMAAWEILGCLCNGATLLIREDDLTETASRADVIIATPSILGSIEPERCSRAKTVAVAGEPCPRLLADRWAAFCTFYNACGLTETTIVNTMQMHHPDAERLTIGRPTPNNTVYVLDENLKPVAIGEVGVMWAGGDCITPGYISNPALTDQRYQPDPFLGGGRMMFNTCDLGRWTEDGELEHLGRIDDQVKIRGFRVELDLVSVVLETVDGCETAATLKLDDRNLVSFVTPSRVDIKAAYDALAQALPYCCKPSIIIAKDSLPRTSCGKVDKRALMDIALAEHRRRSGRLEEAE